MSANLIGALIGLGLAVVDFVLLRVLAGRVQLPETKTALTVAGASQLILLPLVGWFVGPLFVGD